MTSRARLASIALLAICTSTGCYRGVDDAATAGGADGGDGDGGDGDGDGEDGGVAAACADADVRGTDNVSMRRLTRAEVMQSMEAVVGPDVMAASTVLQAAVQIPGESPGDLVADFQNGHAIEHVAGLLVTAEAVASEVGADATARGTVFGACADTADTACAGSFLDMQARRILKRPLSAERRQALLSGFEAEGAGLAGMQWLLSRLLQAPEAVFHLEPIRAACDPDPVACPDVPGGLVAIDDWAVASRLSYALTGQGPDDDLLDAAARGELRTVAQVRPHAERLVDSAAARRQLSAVLDSWLLLGTRAKPNLAVAGALGIDADGLAEEAREELLEYAAYQVFDADAGAAELLGAAIGFPRSQRMAELYGSEVAAGDAPVTLPGGHGGLVLRVSPLMSGHPYTSPILRGAYVRKRVMCDDVPLPDPAAVAEGLAELDAADRTVLSTRQVVEAVTAPPLCAGCHQLINPLGFAMEGFDPFGRARTEEVVYDEAGVELARHPLDTVVDDPILDDDGPDRLTGAEDLAGALADSAKARACIAERLYTYGWLRPAGDGDACTIAQVALGLQEGGSIKDAWIDAVVAPELFVRTAEDSQ